MNRIGPFPCLSVYDSLPCRAPFPRSLTEVRLVHIVQPGFPIKSAEEQEEVAVYDGRVPEPGCTGGPSCWLHVSPRARF